jgi:ribosomal-protein-alanine N-acetyltransferase
VTEFTSRRILFRTLTEADVLPKYADWLNDDLVSQYLETRFDAHSVDTCKRFVAAMNADAKNNLLGMFDLATKNHIGNIKLGPVTERHLSAELSLFIGDRSYWGKGIATEAIAAVTQWAFEELGLERVEAGCYEENIGSLRAFLKAGYSVEGYFRKSVIAGGKRSGSFWLGMLKHDTV